MDPVHPLLTQIYFGNSVNEYLNALALFIGTLLFFALIKRRVFVALEKWAKHTKTDLDDEIMANLKTIPRALYFVVALFFGFQLIRIHPLLSKLVEVALIVLVFYWIAKVASKLIEYGLFKLAQKRGVTKRQKNTTYMALSLVAKILLWSTGVLLILSNLGVNITALVASLGIGGIAIALALQNILGDIFSSFSLYLDKPFEIGDYIVVGDYQGTVKKIGLKTTRIEALQGEEIVISNNELTSSKVQNFKKLKTRRISFNLGVTYDTKPSKLSKIPKLIKEIMAKTKKVSYYGAYMREFGDSSLNFQIIYYVKSNDYQEYLDTQQKLNLAIVKTFEKEKIEFAFPTRTIHIQKEG